MDPHFQGMSKADLASRVAAREELLERQMERTAADWIRERRAPGFKHAARDGTPNRAGG